VRLIQALQSGVILGDGANGTWLSYLGFAKQPYDIANLEAPDLVREVHRAYFEAGSDFVETNTFAANLFKLEGLSLDARAVAFEGARLAREAAGAERMVLGAIGPSGRALAPFGALCAEELRQAVALQAEALAEGGVDGFLLESFIRMDEMRETVKAVRSVSSLPILVSKAFIEDGEMLAEGLPTRVAIEMSELEGVVAVGANCIVGPQRMLDIVRMMAEGADHPILAFPTPGLPQLVKGNIAYDSRPEYFAKAAARLVAEGARILGGCCGTTPEHIRCLRRELGASRPVAKPRVTVTRAKLEKEPLPQCEASELGRKLASGKFVVAVELDMPRGLKVDKPLAGAALLKEHGADVINVPDGARARLRMNSTAVATLIQTHVGIEAIMHFSCRDRNLLAIQSDILGAHALGLRNILAVTGDPSNIGDYPSATGVFDIDAVGLIRILARFNEGMDMGGYSVGMRCAFTIACAYNPLSIDPALEDDRLKRKLDAGAQVVYTQPIFQAEVVERVADLFGRLRVPVLIGVLPLRSYRHCEFMHNEVPGMIVPDSLRQALANAPDDAAALEMGVAAAQALASLVRKAANGLYLMPPAGNAEIARRVMEAC
jgi:homocysteine S-methyltransferase